MITYNYETDFVLEDENSISNWIIDTIHSETSKVGEVNYIFCDDTYLHDINVEFLNHDTLTDIISFDYTEQDIISGDIYISVERVRENASTYQTTFQQELQRVMIHGILHYCGYKDKSENEQEEMRVKENFYLSKLQ